MDLANNSNSFIGMANQAYLKPFNKEFQVVNLRISDLEKIFIQ